MRKIQPEKTKVRKKMAKRSLAIALALSMVLGNLSFAAEQPERSNTSSEAAEQNQSTEAKEIKTVEALLSMKDQQAYILCADLKIPDEMQQEAALLGTKKGVTLLGDGYTISNLKKPLFEELQDAKIEHLYLQAEITDTTSTGVLSNQITDSTIEGCGIKAVLQNTEAAQVGALAGEAVGTQIKNCFSTGTIEGKERGAGLAGLLSGTIENSYSTADLTASETAYGIAGGDTADIKDCYFAGTAHAGQVPETIYQAGDPLPAGDWQEADGSYPKLSQTYIEIQKEQAIEINKESITIKAAEEPVQEEEQAAKENTQEGKANGPALLSLDTNGLEAGASDTQTTTSILITATAGTYYKAVPAGDAAPTLSSTVFATAKKEGWTQKSGSDGTLILSGFAWNTSYDVYECKEAGTGTVLGTVTTNKGTLTGTVTTTGTALTGETLTSEITGTQITDGTWSYEQSDSLQSTTWTAITGADTNSFQLTAEQNGRYVRARYQAKNDSAYTGSVAGEASYVRTALTGVTISGTAMNGETLTAEIVPAGADTQVDYSWYQKDQTEQIGGGKTYQIKAGDIGKQLYVKATAKQTGAYLGTVESTVTNAVATKQYEKPGLLTQGVTDESSMWVSVKNGTGTYKIQYKEIDGDFGDNKELVTNDGTILVVGLKANTTYLFRAKQVASNGFLESDWSEMQAGFKTTAAIVKGEITIAGEAIFGKTLTAKATEANGTGKFIWYRGTEKIKEEPAAGYESAYTLKKEDIGKQLRVEYVGTEDYAGKLFQYTSTIEKGTHTIPGDLSMTASDITDTSAKITLPTNTENRTYQVGYGVSEATPLATLTGTFASGAETTISGLPRNTTQYLFVRYAEDDCYQASEWVKASGEIKTTKTTVTKAPEFKTTPQRGERLELSLKDENHPTGSFTLEQTVGDTTTELDQFFPVEGKENTIYYDVPGDAALNTTYTVTFTAKGDFEGTTDATSPGVVEAKGVTQYDKPVKPELVAKTDTTFTVQMPAGSEGDYQFKYVGADNEEHPIEKSYKAEGQLTIDDLDRVSTYRVMVKRVADSTSTKDSEYSEALEITTEKTPITGYMSIDEQYPRSGNTITATYHEALYIPSGNDKDGSKMQWYRVDSATGEETKITNAVTNAYTVTNADIGYQLKAVFTSNETTFTGSKEVLTKEVQGEKLADPGVPTITADATLYADKIQMKIGVSETADTWYQVREVSEEAPKSPKNAVDAAAQKWTKATATTANITTKYDGSKLKASTKYVVYAVKAADQKESSNVAKGNEAMSGIFLQSGTVNMSGKAHVGETLTATLAGANNTKGQWKWYYSNNAVELYKAQGSAPIFSNNNWIEIKEGYDKTANVKNSILTVPDEAKGHFLKAVFTGSESDGYHGNVEYSTANTKPTGSYEKYVTKTYTEKLTVSGKPYEGETITVTLEGSDRDFTTSGLVNEKGIQLQKDGGANNQYLNCTAIANQTANSFEVKIANTTSTHNDWDIKGWITGPNRKIYRKADGTDVGSDYTFSAALEKKFVYSDGRISTSEDLDAFIKGDGKYSDRTKSYVITDNIDMKGRTSPPNEKNKFSGKLNGDYHTISNLTDSLFEYVGQNSSGKNAVVKNIIFLNANINKPNLNSTGSASIIGRGVDGVDISRIMAVNSNIISNQRVGIIAGRCIMPVNISEIFSAGGSVKNTGNVGDRNGAGGVVGNVENGGIITDVGSINTTIGTEIVANSKNIYVGGLVGQVGASESGITSKSLTVSNVYSASKFNLTTQPTQKGGIIGGFYTSYGAAPISMNKAFYDNDVNTNAASSDVNKGTGKSTKELTGASLQSSFGNDKWMYKEGFYPRLKWLEEDALSISPDAVNIMNLYAATKGAFTSTDGKTKSEDLLLGKISGPIQIPTEFQRTGFTVKSKTPSVLTVSAGGVITPLKANTSCEIVVSYLDSSTATQIQNTYTFTSTIGLKAFDDVTVAGTTEVGKTLTAEVTPSDAATGVSYQWYRKKTGTDGTGTAITGAKASTYKLTEADAGCELRVQVSKDGYGTTVSSWTNPVIVGQPTTAPTITDITDGSAKFTGTGSEMPTYEFAYARSLTGEKTIVPTTGNDIIVTGLGRNTTYYAFARIPAGNGYEASEWSASAQFTTPQTAISGTFTVSDARAVGQTITFTFSSTNAQTLAWTLYRAGEDGAEGIPLTPTTTENNTITYTLTSEDVGKEIYPKVVGTGDFEGEQALETNRPRITKAKAATPSGAPVVAEESATDTSIEVGYAGTADKQYQFGYAPYGSNDITAVDAPYSTGQTAEITGLDRNTRYRFFVREADSTGYIASDWSSSSEGITKATELVGIMTMTGTAKVDEEVTFAVPETNEQTGRWVLERRDENDVRIATLTNYTEDLSGRTITYKVVPADAGYKLKASLVGDGDFQGTIERDTDVVLKAKYATPAADAFQVTKVSDTSMQITLGNMDGNYIVQYTEQGTSDVKVTGAVKGNTSVTIEGLKRNTLYELAIKRSGGTGVIGYEDSEYSDPIPETTSKTSINGKVTLTGEAKLGEILTAAYVSGNYNPTADDKNGTWQWYRGTTEIPGETQSTHTVTEADKGYYLAAEYTMPEHDADLTGSKRALSDKIFKEAYLVPTGGITVEAKEADEVKGSTLNIRNSVDTLVYKAVLADSDAPALPDRGTEDAKGWIKGTGTDIPISGLEANRAYIVYAYTPEDDTYGASPMIASKRILTAKELLGETITLTGTMAVLQDITAQISTYGRAPSGTFRWSVADKKSAQTWETLNLGTDNNTAAESRSLAQIPLKYFNQYLKVTFIGSGDYEGTISVISETPLLGKPLSGQVTLTSEVSSIFTPITAAYDGTDETSGSWKWYLGTNEIDASAYDNFGPQSTYTPTTGDIGKVIKAVYTAENPIYAGTKEITTTKVEKAEQNQPASPVIVRINQTKVEVAPPTNYRTEAAPPTVLYGYQEAMSNDLIVWQQQPSTTLALPKANQDYLIYAKYQATTAYKESEQSAAPASATTGLLALEDTRLTLTYDKTGVAATSIGAQVSAIYTGAGYEAGVWNVYNAAGQVVDMTGVEGTENSTAQTNTYDYTFTAEDLGGYVTLEFAAKPDTSYGGAVQKRTKQIVYKEALSYGATKPSCAVEEKTKIRVDMVSGQEYLLSTSSTAPELTDAGWETYSGASHLYEGLLANTQYYVWTRIAETETHAMSDPVHTAITTEGGIDFGALTVSNRTDGKVPCVTKEVALPEEIKKAASLTISGTGASLTNQGTVLDLISTDQFVKADGTANANVYEQGSDWGNQNFAYQLEFLDENGTVLSTVAAPGTSVPETAAKIRFTFYRANAVTRGGTYQFRLDMNAVNEDGSKAPVSVDAALTMETTLTAAVPLSMNLLVQNETVTSLDRPTIVANENDMPLLIELNEQVAKGADMPELWGKLEKTSEDVTRENEMYVKAATDGSSVLSGNGIWFTTTGESLFQPFMTVGAQGKGNYKLQGCYSEQTTFPFAEGATTIDKAYQFTYRYGISKTSQAYQTSDTTAP